MDYLYYSVILFNVATYGYLVATLLVIFYLVKPERRRLLRLFKILAVAVVIVHTAALGLRWLQAGFDRPPWTNLYESLIFFSWGLGTVATVVILRNQAYYLATFLLPLTFAGLGLAAMVPDKTITDLVPALQSHWIKIHVVMAAMAYPGFITAGLISLFYLLKCDTKPAHLHSGFALFGVFCLLVVGRGDVLGSGVYNLPLMEWVDGRFFKIPVDPAAKPIVWQETPIPFAGALFLMTALTYLLTIVYAWASLRNHHPLWHKTFVLFNRIALALYAFLLAVIYYNIAGREDLALAGNPYEMAILVSGFLVEAFFVLYSIRPQWLSSRLPMPEWLDQFAYKVTLFAFPFMTLLLITGAIWAYSAWGRYWGWDPKETCALVTWLIFAAYLHSRRYFGTAGRPAAIINIIGGISVFFTFLGANLVLSGLHSYGAQ